MSRYNLRKRESAVKYDEVDEPPRKRRSRQSIRDNESSDADYDQNLSDDDNVPKSKRGRKRKQAAAQNQNEAQENAIATEQEQHVATETTLDVKDQQDDRGPIDTEPRQESNDDQLEDVLHALLELHHLDESRVNTMEGSSQTISEALAVNRELQQEAKAQIAWINQRIVQNEALKRKIRVLSMQESNAHDRRMEVHKKYPNKLEFFVDDQGNKPVLTPTSSSGGVSEDLELERKPWSNSERNRLFTGIHTEAQRSMVFDLVAQHNEHKIWEIDKLDNSELENIEVDKLDWNRISTIHVKTRTPMQCIIQWTTQEHPKINKKPWSKAESAKLDALVQDHGFEGQWEKIAAELRTNRTASQCFAHYQSEYNNSKTTKTWSKEDDEALKQAVEMMGEGNWQQVAVILGNRTGNQCLQRWSKCISPAIRRDRWNEEEDRALRGAVDFYGVGHWNRIRRHLPGRTDMQCRERWMNILDPNIKTEPLSKEETTRLLELVKEHGRKWSLMTTFFPGRTDNFLLRTYKVATAPAKSAKKRPQKTAPASRESTPASSE